MTHTVLNDSSEHSAILMELKQCEEILRIDDKTSVFLFDANNVRSALLIELGRLREEAFQLVGEGTGNEIDLDEYDLHYHHLILWDNEKHQIAGAYRLKPSTSNATQHPALYTNSLFDYKANAEPIFEQGLELGRSFIRAEYWGTRSLDHLWQGIAAYLRRNPNIRYLFGGVSITAAMPEQAKHLLVSYYQHFYGTPFPIASARNPFKVITQHIEGFDLAFEGLDAKEAFLSLRKQLAVCNSTIPPLYKQYCSLCELEGVHFHAWNIDPDFSDCIDGLVVIDLRYLTKQKRKRYQLEDHCV